MRWFEIQERDDCALRLFAQGTIFRYDSTRPRSGADPDAPVEGRAVYAVLEIAAVQSRRSFTEIHGYIISSIIKKEFSDFYQLLLLFKACAS